MQVEETLIQNYINGNVTLWNVETSICFYLECSSLLNNIINIQFQNVLNKTCKINECYLVINAVLHNWSFLLAQNIVLVIVIYLFQLKNKLAYLSQFHQFFLFPL